mgnify:CR=1 FL=1
MSAEYNAKFANTDIATRAIHAGQEPDPTTGAVVTPVFATSTFKQDGVLGLRGGHDYSRSINPTRTSFDEQLAAVEGGKYALSFSSGLAAIDVLLRSTIKPGDNIEVGSSTGVVKDITWRHTTIRNGAGEEVLIPNSIISKTALTHLPPTNQVSLAIVVTTEGQHLDEVAEAIERKAGEAAAGIGKVVKQPKLTFSEITAQGYAGSISFSMADSRTTGRATDAVLRAVAPLTRTAAPDRAEQVLEEAQQEAEEAAAQEAAGHAPTKPKPKPKPTPKQKQRPSFRKRMARALRLGKEEQS